MRQVPWPSCGTVSPEGSVTLGRSAMGKEPPSARLGPRGRGARRQAFFGTGVARSRASFLA
jgi:hypothetical protein